MTCSDNMADRHSSTSFCRLGIQGAIEFPKSRANAICVSRRERKDIFGMAFLSLAQSQRD
jgi:hypothetical protein